MQILTDISDEPEDPDPADIAVAMRDPAWREAGAEGGFDPETVCRRAAQATLTCLGAIVPEDGELSIVLADDEFLRRLNREYRGVDRPTNVLAFPSGDGAAGGATVLFGDVVVSRQTIAAEAAAQGKALSDHLAHLVVHGALHLFGFDHETATQAARMESVETAALAGLGIADPYDARAAAGREPQS